MGNFKGTFRLLKLAFRRDRFKLLVWIVLIISLCLVTFPMMEESFGTEKARINYQSSMSISMFGRMFGGPLDGNSLGSIAMIEMFIYIMVLVAFMSSMIITRHTRLDEEQGCAEIISSTPTGRYASLTAALVVALISNLLLLIASGIFMSLQHNTPVMGVWLMLISVFGIGLTFAAITAVISQLTTSARKVNMISGSLICVCFLLRAIGDSFGPAPAFGETVKSLWLSWLSPFGWAQQVFPFTRQNVWLLWLYVAVIVIFLLVAYIIQGRRELGAGAIADRLGRKRASRFLASTTGVVWKQTRGMLALWGVVGVVLGFIFGGSAHQFKDLLNSSEMIRMMLASMGGEKNIVNAYLGYMIMLAMVVVVVYVIQVLQRMRLEELGGQAEQVLSTSVSRVKWVCSYIGVTFVGLFIFTVVVSLSTGIGYMIGASGDWKNVYLILTSSVIYIPAVLVYIGIIIAVFGLLPKFTIVFSWLLFISSLLIILVGEFLKLPNWVIDLVPFKHIPNLLVDNVSWSAVIIMLFVSFLSATTGIVAFCNRDISTK